MPSAEGRATAGTFGFSGCAVLGARRGHFSVLAAAPFSEHAVCSMAAPYSEHAKGTFLFQTGQQQDARAALQGITTPPLCQCDDVGEGGTRTLKARADGDARPITQRREDGFSCHPLMGDLVNPS